MQGARLRKRLIGAGVIGAIGLVGTVGGFLVGRGAPAMTQDARHGTVSSPSNTDPRGIDALAEAWQPGDDVRDAGAGRVISLENETETWISPDDVLITDYAPLKRLAEQGDPIAATKLYLLLAECHQLMQRNPFAESQESIDAYRGTGVDVEKMLLDRERKIGECAALDLSSDDLRFRGRWLAAAAEAGFIHAQLIFASDPEAIIGTARDMLANPESVQRYRVDSMRYLARAAAAGSPSGLTMLADSYGNGIVTTRDRAMAHGLMLAAVQLHPGGARYRWSTRFRDGLSPEELRRAQSIADEYVRRMRGG